MKKYIIPANRSESEATKDSNSSFTCPSETVVTMRRHESHENGSTKHPTSIVKASATQKSLSLLLVVLSLLSFSSVKASEGGEDYLKEGKLKQRIEVRRTDIGCFGTNVKSYAIEVDGSWSMVSYGESVRGKTIAKGKLDAEQLVQLAEELAKHDLVNLRNHDIISGKFSFKSVTEIHLGGESSRLVVTDVRYTGEDLKIATRYDAIADAVRKLTKLSK